MQYKQFNLPENHRGISKYGNKLKSVLDVQRSTQVFNLKVDDERQREIEYICLDENEQVKRFIGVVDTATLNPVISKFIMVSDIRLGSRIELLIKSLDNSTKLEEILMFEIFSNLGVITIKEKCIHTFLNVLTYHTNDLDLKQIYTLPTTIRIGKPLLKNYINVKRIEYKVENGEKIKFNEALKRWRENNPKYST